MFSLKSKINLAKAVLLKNTPVYVQFYVSSRCNLKCKQCNIVRANRGIPECSLDEIKMIADNFSKIGVVMVLLTGGEPFLRKDLPEIIREFESRGVHVRMQTNGIASEEQIARAVEYGGRDISISLDTLDPELQDRINGGVRGSWEKTIDTVSLFTKYLPPDKSFASLGCVIQNENLDEVESVIRFATAINFYTSVVPVHISFNEESAFRSPDSSLGFGSDRLSHLAELVERMRAMKREGYLLYDSDEFLDNIGRFVRGEPLTWRRRSDNTCDTPNLYFTVMPNGDFAPCCDYGFNYAVKTFDPGFPEVYRSRSFREEVSKIAGKCSGCMYGCYPEMTISMRRLNVTLERAATFLAGPARKNWPLNREEIKNIADGLRKSANPKKYRGIQGVGKGA